AAIVAIGSGAADQREHEGGNRPGQADESQVERRAGQIVDQPAEGHHLHPATDRRDALAEEGEPEVSIAERTEAATPSEDASRWLRGRPGGRWCTGSGRWLSRPGCRLPADGGSGADLWWGACECR